MSSRTIRQLAVAVTLAAFAANPAAAPAQSRGGWVNFGGPNGQYGGAYEQGFLEGTREGQLDARAGRSLDFERHSAYRSADAGYSRQVGDKGAYQRTFRYGFADGYRAAFQRYDRRAPLPGGFGRSTRGFQDPASARGYSDGFEHGLEDGHDRDRYDPVRHGDYKSADDGYKGGYGSKDSYRNNYRAGFRQGYEEGYRDGARRR
jgi:hypothetical protein